jgi:hypothetical protein
MPDSCVGRCTFDRLPYELIIQVFDAARHTATVPTMRATLARLLRVSKQWHDTVAGCPILWNRIHFGAIDGELGVVQLKVFIERSKDAHIDVQFACFDGVDQPTRRAATVTACSLLRDNLYRVRSLLFTGKIENLFPIPHPLPVLIYLYVAPFDDGTSARVSQITHLIPDAPNLKTFIYNSLALQQRVENPFVGINSRHLRTLRLGGLGGDDPKFVKFISTCSQLRRLSVSYARGWQGAAQLPFLHDLDASGPLGGLSPLLAIAPPLVHLCAQDLTIIHGTVHSIAEESKPTWPPFPHLRTLTLTHKHFGDLTSVLKTSPHIVALDVSSGTGFVALIHALIGDAIAGPQSDPEQANSGESMLAPKLALLRVTFENYLLADPVETRIDDTFLIVSLTQELMLARPNLKVRFRDLDSRNLKALEFLADTFSGRLKIRGPSSVRTRYEGEDFMKLAELYPYNEVMDALDENVVQG